MFLVYAIILINCLFYPYGASKILTHIRFSTTFPSKNYIVNCWYKNIFPIDVDIYIFYLVTLLPMWIMLFSKVMIVFETKLNFNWGNKLAFHSIILLFTSNSLFIHNDWEYDKYLLSFYYWSSIIKGYV
jgi:hypothetical protein